MFFKKKNGANVLSKTLFSECYFLISKVERRDWICERNNFVSKSMCKAFYSQKKIEVSGGLETTLKLKEVFVTAKVSLVPFKVNASLITLL